MSANAECTAFPVDVFINGVDPRFNISYNDAASLLQTSIDNFNQNVGRVMLRQNTNGVPVTFDWNDTSVVVSNIRQNEEQLQQTLSKINVLKQQITNMIAKHESMDTIRPVVDQFNQMVSFYNNGTLNVSNIRAQTNNETLGTFSRVSTYSFIKVFGYESQPALIHVMMHELGHLLGLNHSARNLMDSHANSSFELSGYDADKQRAEYDSACNL
jgi:hypothetical protein